MNDKQLEKINKYIESIEEQLQRVKELVKKCEEERKKEEIKELPGIKGVFDGMYLITEDGSKYEVPANYAAKSRLVCGDTLKMVEEDGKKMFKQVEKVGRKVTEGMISKKEGKYYVLTDYGSFRISDTSAEFNKLKIEDKVSVIIPEKGKLGSFAALDKVLSTKEKEKESEIKQTQNIKDIKKEFVVNLTPSKKKSIKKPSREDTRGRSNFRSKDFKRRENPDVSRKNNSEMVDNSETISKTKVVLEDDDLR